MSTFSGGYGPEEEDGGGWDGLVPTKSERIAESAQQQRQQERALLVEALDLVPRMSDDDPIAPALADWCHKVRAAIAEAAS